MDELDIGGRLDPGASPPPSLQRLTLSQFLPDSGGDFKQTIVYMSRARALLERRDRGASGESRESTFWPIWPIWWQSPIWVMPADLPIKLDPAVLADLVVKRGIGGLADSELNRGIDGFGWFGAEAGNRPVCR